LASIENDFIVIYAKLIEDLRATCLFHA